MTPETGTVVMPLMLTVEDVRRAVDVLKAGNVLHLTVDYELAIHPANAQLAFDEGLAPYCRLP